MDLETTMSINYYKSICKVKSTIILIKSNSKYFNHSANPIFTLNKDQDQVTTT